MLPKSISNKNSSLFACSNFPPSEYVGLVVRTKTSGSRAGSTQVGSEICCKTVRPDSLVVIKGGMIIEVQCIAITHPMMEREPLPQEEIATGMEIEHTTRVAAGVGREVGAQKEVDMHQGLGTSSLGDLSHLSLCLGELKGRFCLQFAFFLLCSVAAR